MSPTDIAPAGSDQADADPAHAVNRLGYRSFRIGGFSFDRDEHFVHIEWPTGSHVMSAETFLKAVMRDVSWSFFYGIVNFDAVIGTMNHYGNVDLFAGRYNSAYRKAGSTTPAIVISFEDFLAAGVCHPGSGAGNRGLVTRTNRSAMGGSAAGRLAAGSHHFPALSRRCEQRVNRWPDGAVLPPLQAFDTGCRLRPEGHNP